MADSDQKPKRKKPRVTKAEKMKRLDRVYKMRLSGATHADLVRYGAENWFLSERAVEKYITEADKAMKSASEVTREALRDKYVAAMDLVISRASAVSDHQTVIKAWQEIAKIRGLYAPPPPQYLNILGVSESLIKTLALEAQMAGHDVGDVFEGMIRKYAAMRESKNSHDE